MAPGGPDPETILGRMRATLGFTREGLVTCRSRSLRPTTAGVGLRPYKHAGRCRMISSAGKLLGRSVDGGRKGRQIGAGAG